MPERRGRAILWLLATIFWMSFIFYMSMQPAVESSAMSHRLGRLIGELMVPGFRHWSMERRLWFAAMIDHPLRKLAHGTEYAILGILLYHTFRNFLPEGGRLTFRWWYPFLFGALYAASDELHQRFVPGRSGELRDVLLDSFGVMAGVLASVLLSRLMKKGNKVASMRLQATGDKDV